MKRALRIFLYVLLVGILALPAVELFLRGEERLAWLTGNMQTEAGLRILGQRLNRRLWTMFLTAGAHDLRVLPGNASTAVLLPPNGHWSAVDFLLPEEMREASRFEVQSDSLGFRGAEKKPTAKHYRILVLGSYQAFGHGVNDDEAYGALLETKLRDSAKLRKLGKHPLVWNGGMQSASLDRGLKVLESKLDQLKPNLVILDYGMTDQVAAGMNPWLQPFAALAKPGTALYERLDRFSRLNSTGPVGGTYLFGMLVNRSMRANLEPNRRIFAANLEKAITLLESRGVNVLLLDQPFVGVPAEVYQKAVAGHPRARFLSVRQALEREARGGGPKPERWLEEFPEAFRAYYQKKVGLGAYLGNMLHLGRDGHRAVAAELARWLEANDFPR